MKKRNVCAIIMIVLMVFNLSACTISQTIFDPSASINYQEVADFSENLVTKFGAVLDLWRADINSLPPEFKAASVEMVRDFVDEDYKGKTQTEIVTILNEANSALNIFGHNFTIFSNPQSGNLNATVIAQLIITMRSMTPIQKQLFYTYLESENDEAFKLALNEDQLAYLNLTKHNMNILLSSVLSDVRDQNPDINLSDERMAMLVEFGRAISAKDPNKHLISNSDNTVTDDTFNQLATQEMLQIIYPGLGATEIAQRVNRVKEGVKAFLSSLVEPDRGVIYNALHAIQYRGLVTYGETPTTPPTSQPQPPPLSPPPSTQPSESPLPTTDPSSTPEVIYTVSESDFNLALQRLSGGAVNITFEIEAEPDAKSMSVTIPKEQLKELSKGGMQALTIESTLLTIWFDKVAIDEDLLIDETGDVVITVRIFKPGDLKHYPVETVGERPIIDIKVTSDDKEINSFKGYAVVKWPYNKSANENADTLVAITDRAEFPVNLYTVYDQQSGDLTFVTKVLATHAIANRKLDFSDVAMWAEEFINYLSAREIIVGVGDGRFAPNENVTRAQFVTMLARIANINTSGLSTAQFIDVPSDEWYAGSVAWAYNNGVVMGIEDNTFEPNSNITREQMATMMKRYILGTTEYPLTATKAKLVFNDDTDISDWAVESVYAMQQADLITGKADNMFDPTGQTTRAEAATVLSKLIRNMTQYYIDNAAFIFDMIPE